MKRILISLIVATILLSGCNTTAEKVNDPVNFYYCTKSIAYNSADGVISHEVREAAELRDEHMDLLHVYLQGPTSEHLASPFPNDTDIMSVEVLNGVCSVTLTEHFAVLTGIDLTVACTCLSMTVMELTGTQIVEIKSFQNELDGQKSITMNRDNLLFMDNSTAQTVPAQE